MNLHRGARSCPASRTLLIERVERERWCVSEVAMLVLYLPAIVFRPLDIAQAFARGNEAAKADARGQGARLNPLLSCFMGLARCPGGSVLAARGTHAVLVHPACHAGAAFTTFLSPTPIIAVPQGLSVPRVPMESVARCVSQEVA